MLTIIESIRLYEITIINVIQSQLSGFESLFLLFNSLGDPKNAYIYYFIISLIFISYSSAFKLLWASVMSEWINLIFKWIISDDRPFWSSNLINHYNKRYGLNIQLKQLSTTCESIKLLIY